MKMPMKSVRFFGKILGLENNYYVAETEPSEPLPPLDDPIVAKATFTPDEIKAMLKKPAPGSQQQQQGQQPQPQPGVLQI